MDSVVETFISDVRLILAERGAGADGMQQLAERMRRLLREPAVRAAHAGVLDGGDAGGVYRDTGRRSELLYTDETGLTLVRSRFDPDEPTPIHSHSTWGVVGVYAGRDRHQAWKRCDAGTGAGHAQIELLEERVLVPGDVVLIPHPPQDIHAQQGEGEPAYEFVLFGRNAMVIPRLIFDPAQQHAREVIPGHQQ
jgi:predicted metal-dependent enzyme (double-stranded beta helix superfamily)